MSKNYTPEELLTRWEARRELQNIMGKLSQSYLMMEEAQGYERFWSKREDVCLGVNDGWYSGAAAVKGYYDALGEKIQLASDIIAKAFPEKLAGKTREELYGVGQIGIKPIDTFVIEIAGDGQTAKGIWSLHGTYADMTPSGPVSYWDWGYWCADFILEDGAWKIWHFNVYPDLTTPVPDAVFDDSLYAGRTFDDKGNPNEDHVNFKPDEGRPEGMPEPYGPKSIPFFKPPVPGPYATWTPDEDLPIM